MYPALLTELFGNSSYLFGLMRISLAMRSSTFPFGVCPEVHARFDRSWGYVVFDQLNKVREKETNRPFYQYGGHIELIGFKEYYGMPRGHEHDPINSHQYLRALFGPIFFYVFLEKDCNEKKKIVVPSLDVITNAFFQRNIH